MGSRRRAFMIPVLVLLFAFACAGQQKTVSVAPGERTIDIKASDFKFDPDDLKAHKGDVLTLNIENISSGTLHNITVKSPQGNTMAEADIQPKSSAKVTVRLTEAGTYSFYCDRPFHSSLGMKGKIEVAP